MAKKGSDRPPASTKVEINAAIATLTTVTHYWQQLERNRLSNARWAFGVFAFLLVLMLGIAFGTFYYISQPLTTKPETAEIVHLITRAILLGTIAAFVIWGLRQALRLWAVQQELLIDAQEKLGVLSAFAALKGAGWLTSKDLTVIITALMRSPRLAAVTEAPPPQTPLEALTKSLSKIIQDKTK